MPREPRVFSLKKNSFENLVSFLSILSGKSSYTIPGMLVMSAICIPGKRWCLLLLLPFSPLLLRCTTHTRPSLQRKIIARLVVAAVAVVVAVLLLGDHLQLDLVLQAGKGQIWVTDRLLSYAQQYVCEWVGDEYLEAYRKA